MREPLSIEEAVERNDWQRSVVESIIYGLENTRSEKIRRKLEDALQALNENDECLHTIDETVLVPEGIPFHSLALQLRKTFSDEELTELRPDKIRLFVIVRWGTEAEALFAVRLLVKAAIQRARDYQKKLKAK